MFLDFFFDFFGFLYFKKKINKENIFFFVFLGFLSNLLRLILKVTKGTTGHRKSPKKMGQNSIISSFLREGQKKPRAKAPALRRS